MTSKNDSITSKGKKQSDILERGTEKKRRNGKILRFGKRHFTEGNVIRMQQCGSYWEMVADKTRKKKRSTKSNRCKCRWCARCAWLQSRKDAFRIATLTKYIRVEEKKEFIFLTLTAPNVKGDKLKEEIDRYNVNFKKLMERAEIKQAVKGYIRKLEVTYNKEPIITAEMWYGNKEKHIKAMGYYFAKLDLKVGDANPNYNTYHPHFHVMIAVNPSYFKDGRKYISPKRWLELWQEAMGDQTITQVSVVRVTANAGNEINEIAKYTAKDSDYAHSPEVFECFYRALAGRQTATYSGCFAKANKKYKKGELDGYKDKDLTEYVYALLYKWERAKGEYKLENVRELTAEERAKMHGQAIEEIEVED